MSDAEDKFHFKVHLVKLIETNWDEEACRDWRLPKWKKNAPSSDSENLDLPTMRLQYNRLAKKHGCLLYTSPSPRDRG